MKYLLTILIFSFLSCKKDSEQKPKYDPPPTVTNITASTQTTGSIVNPKFTITLNVPDTASVKQFMIFLKVSPTTIPLVIDKPKTGTYTLTDIYNSYPLGTDKKTYTSAFLMADNYVIYNASFDIN